MHAPDLCEKVRNTPEAFVFAGAKLPMMGSLGQDQSHFDNIVERHEKRPPIRELFNFLFSALSNKRRYGDCGPDDIAFRRPLLTLLRLKALPNTFTSADIEAILALDHEDMAAVIREFVIQGETAAFSQRLAEMAQVNLIENSHFAWELLLEINERTPVRGWDDELNRKYAVRQVVDDLISAARKESEVASKLPEVIEKLIERKAFVSAAVLIRSVDFRLERGPESAQTLAAYLDLGTLRALGQRLVKLAKLAAREQGTVLHSYIVYLAQDIGAWDKDDKAQYTSLVSNNDELFDRLVFESFGGNYMVEAASINDLFMPLQAFLTRLQNRYETLPADAPIDLKRAYESALERLAV